LYGSSLGGAVAIDLAAKNEDEVNMRYYHYFIEGNLMIIKYFFLG
jgi:hypothetical protein